VSRSHVIGVLAVAASINGSACASAADQPVAAAGAPPAGMANAGTAGGASLGGQPAVTSGGNAGAGGNLAGSPSVMSQGGSLTGSAGMGGASAAGDGGSAGEPIITGCAWEVTAGRTPLFDGTDLAQWKSLEGGAAPWKVNPSEQTFEVVPFAGNIQTKLTFEDLCLHLEYLTPMYPSSVSGQDRGNSGIYLKSAYEMQILDSAGQPAANNTCGAVYSLAAPLVVACNAQLIWNTYEIEFKASKWSDGMKTANAKIARATLNGQLVQLDVELNPKSGATQAGVPDAAGPQPLMLQDHHNEVKFRNVWVRVPK
jgi:hypothetical protein